MGKTEGEKPTTTKAKAPKKRAPRKPTARRGLDRMTREEFLRSALATAESMRCTAEPGSIAAIQALKVGLETRKALDEVLDKKPGDPWAGLTEEEIRDKLRTEGRAMPDQHLSILVEVYCERHGLSFPLRAVAGGGR